jgi:hypothetical protein
MQIGIYGCCEEDEWGQCCQMAKNLEHIFPDGTDGKYIRKSLA